MPRRPDRAAVASDGHARRTRSALPRLRCHWVIFSARLDWAARLYLYV